MSSFGFSAREMLRFDCRQRRPNAGSRVAIDHFGGQRLGTTAAAKRLMAIADVLEQTAPDFANPPAPQRVFEKIRQRPLSKRMMEAICQL